MNKRKRKPVRISSILIFLLFFLGLSVLLYPTISNWWNTRVQSKVIAVYDETVESLTAAENEALLEAATQYNAALASIGSARTLVDPEVVDGYEELLDVTGTGMMGYVTIPKLSLHIPIYHGTDTDVLAAGAGHIQGTSLPIGGASTHSVLAGHRGLPSAKLFTDLDQLSVGDIFTITVLGETITYKIDQILVVLPEELEALYIETGEDYVTLMTCTPYGINSHRLLVRGVRTDDAYSRLNLSAEAYKVNPMKVAGVVSLPMLLLLLVGQAWIHREELRAYVKRKKRAEKTTKE